MDRCLSDDAVLALAAGRASPSAALQGHLGECGDCRALVAMAMRTARRPPPAARPDADTEPRAAQEHPFAAGSLLGPYVLDEPLGAGAMGVVWAAHDARDGTRVAVKLPRPGPSPLAERFARELCIAQALVHRNIVRVVDTVASPYGAAMVMERLDGETLAERLQRDHTLPVPVACGIAHQIAEALSFAHERGVVHRDLKPANVMLVGAGDAAPGGVRILDFGVAKRVTDGSEASRRLTRTGAAVGTPLTMAPEQLHGERDVDGRADVWALGVILYRALTGAYPLTGRSVGELIKGLREPAPIRPVEAMCPKLPLDLAALVMQALEVRRDERLASADEFLPVLARWRS